MIYLSQQQTRKVITELTADQTGPNARMRRIGRQCAVVRTYVDKLVEGSASVGSFSDPNFDQARLRL